MRKSHTKTLKFFSQLIAFDATVQLFVLVLMFIISKDPCTAQLICPIICLHVKLSVGQHYTLLFLSMYLVWSRVITSLSLPPQRSNVLKLTSHYFSCWKCASNFKSFILSIGKSSSTCKQTKFSILSNTENSRLCLEPPLNPYRQCFQNFQTIFFFFAKRLTLTWCLWFWLSNVYLLSLPNSS